MLAQQIISNTIPSVKLTDNVSFALQLMDDYDLQHLPVISDQKYMGIISKSDLLNTESDVILASLEYQLINISVKTEEHFLMALQAAVTTSATIVPVLTVEKEIAGVITLPDLVRASYAFLGQNEPGGIIVLEMERRNFSVGEINRLVETNDAVITQLNTAIESVSGLFIVTLRINKTEISQIIAAFQRYEYSVRYYFGEESYKNELKENYDLLMTYINI